MESLQASVALKLLSGEKDAGVWSLWEWQVVLRLLDGVI